MEQFEYKRVINKSIKSHTLSNDLFGYGLIATNFADKYLAGQVTMYKSYSWLKRKFQKYVGCAVKPKHEKVDTNYIWICWLQGMDAAPQVVRDCYDSISYWEKDKRIVVITAENFMYYVQFPDFIIEKWKKGLISNTHFSDLLRLELIIRYGGLWLDATTLLTGKVPEYILNTDFFVYRNGWMDMEMINMASWLIYSAYTNNVLLVETRELLYMYWEKYDYMKNYFLMHMFFRMVTDKFSDDWNKIPYYNQIDNHMLAEILAEKYDKKRVAQICRLTNVHKLSYKFKDEPTDEFTVMHLKEIFSASNF